MFYERELHFLRETLKKCRVQTYILSPEDKMSKAMDGYLGDMLDIIPASSQSAKEYFGNLRPCTVYKASDEFGTNYIYLLLPEVPHENILLIGPYITAPLPPRRLLEVGEKSGISPKYQNILNEYFLNIPIVPDGSPLFLMLDAFCERIWGAGFASVDVERERYTPASPISKVGDSSDFDDIMVNMKSMEQRYHFENEIMQAVSLGHQHKMDSLLSAFTPDSFEMRSSDTLRNMKNYCIIMNTLLRKAAEQGGVHPVYLDRVSSNFAVKNEQIMSFEDSAALMKEMFRTYCRLVRKHSMKDLSPLVQKAVILIDSDLSANLTLSTIAENQKVSPGYLSTLFKKETGKTVTEYIRDKRIKHATYLLGTTHLQIQTVALHCGIMDVQYFSKIFKKQTGKTPKEYREFMKQSTL